MLDGSKKLQIHGVLFVTTLRLTLQGLREISHSKCGTELGEGQDPAQFSLLN